MRNMPRGFVRTRRTTLYGWRPRRRARTSTTWRPLPGFSQPQISTPRRPRRIAVTDIGSVVLDQRQLVRRCARARGEGEHEEGGDNGAQVRSWLGHWGLQHRVAPRVAW